jgi:D-serine deaminase-like pyridoxal phosphate-dependent protein
MIDAGLPDVLIANQVVGSFKVAELARIAGQGRAIVAVDSAANVSELGDAAKSVGAQIEVLVETDVVLHRVGVRSVDGAVDLAQDVERRRGLRLAGLLGYEGHCMLEPDPRRRLAKTKEANALLLEAVDAFERQGLCSEIVAAGGSGRGTSPVRTRASQVHAGSYIFMDASSTGSTSSTRSTHRTCARLTAWRWRPGRANARLRAGDREPLRRLLRRRGRRDRRRLANSWPLRHSDCRHRLGPRAPLLTQRAGRPEEDP